jgi:hypothetical protein
VACRGAEENALRIDLCCGNGILLPFRKSDCIHAEHYIISYKNIQAFVNILPMPRHGRQETGNLRGLRDAYLLFC